MKNPCRKCEVQTVLEVLDRELTYTRVRSHQRLNNFSQTEMVRIEFCDNCEKRFDYVVSVHNPYMKLSPQHANYEDRAPTDVQEEIAQWLKKLGVANSYKEFHHMEPDEAIKKIADALQSST